MIKEMRIRTSESSSRARRIIFFVPTYLVRFYVNILIKKSEDLRRYNNQQFIYAEIQLYCLSFVRTRGFSLERNSERENRMIEPLPDQSSSRPQNTTMRNENLMREFFSRIWNAFNENIDVIRYIISATFFVRY